MKVFVQVTSIGDLPSNARSKAIIINPSNWIEIINFLDGKDTLQYLYITTGVSLDNFLKTFEDFKGDLVVYTPVVPTAVVLSRFTRVVNRVPVKDVPLIPENPITEVYHRLKESLNAY